MITITEQIKLEIETSINQFKKQIAKEMAISEDLRHKDKIKLWSSKIVELQKALINGVI
jgi:hypothetical protein